MALGGTVSMSLRQARRQGMTVGRLALLVVATIVAAGMGAALLLAYHVGVASADPSVSCSGTAPALTITLSNQSTASKPVVIGATPVYSGPTLIGYDYNVTAAGISGSGCSNLLTTLYPTVSVQYFPGSPQTQYIKIDNSTGAFASSQVVNATTPVACAVQFALQIEAPASGNDTLAIVDDTTSPGAGDDTVGAASSVSGGNTAEGVTLSEGACTSPDVTVSGGYAVQTIDALGATSVTDNELDLSGNTATAMTINAQADSTTTPGTVTGMPGAAPVQFSGEQIVKGPVANTTFVPATATPLTFVGASGTTNTLDLSSGTAGNFTTLDANMASGSASSCGTATVGEVTTTGSLVLADPFCNVSTVIGSPSIPTTFQPDPTLESTLSPVPLFEGGGDGKVDVSSFVTPDTGGKPVTGLTVALGADTAGTQGQVSGSVAGTPVTFADFYGVTEAKGSNTLPTTFAAGSTTVPVTFVGGSGLSNALDLTGESAFSTLTVSMTGGTAADCSAPIGQVTSTGGAPNITDPFCNITAVSAPTVPTTFKPSSTSVTFAGGSGVSNTLDLTGESGYLALNVAMTGGSASICGASTVGQVTSTGGSPITDPFCNVSVVDGNTSIPTTFQPDPSLTSTPSPVPLFVGGGLGVVDVSNFASPDGHGKTVGNLVVSVNGDTAGSKGQVSASVNGSSVTFANFSGVDGANGSASIPTDFQPGSAGGVTLVGGLGGATLDVAGESGFTGITVLMAGGAPAPSCAAATVGQMTTTGGSPNINDSFCGIGAVNGAPGIPTTFQPDPTFDSTPATPPVFNGAGAGIVDTGGFVSPNTNGSPKPVSALTLAVNGDTLASQGLVTAQVNGVPTTYASFYGVSQARGSTSLPTDFQPGTASSVLFVGQDATGTAGNGDTLDMSLENGQAAGITVAINGNSHTSLGALTGVSSSNTALNDSFYGVDTVLGSPEGTTFQPGAVSGPTFVGACQLAPNQSQPASDVVDLSNDAASPITVDNMTTGSALPALPANVTASTYSSCASSQSDGTVVSGGSSADFFTVTVIKGSKTVGTNFQPGASTGVTFVGQGTGLTNSIDLSGDSGLYDVTMNGDSSGNPGSFGACGASCPAPPTTPASQGSFQQIEAITGSQGGTAFVAGSSGGVTFNGLLAAISTNTLYLPASSALTTVDVGNDSSGTPGQVTNLSSGFGGATSDAFSWIGNLNGNSGAGGTTFDANAVGSNKITYVGAGTGTNTLSFAPLTSAAALTIDVANGTTGDNTAWLGSSSGSPIAAFSGIGHFGGCNSPSGCTGTMFEAAANTTDQYAGLGSSNTLDFSNVASGSGGVAVNESDGAGTATPSAGGSITFSGVQTFNGSQNNDIFTIGAGNASFSGGGGSDEVTLANDPAGIDFSLAAGAPELATITTSQGSDTASNITTFIGSNSGSNTFVSDGRGGHTFEASSSGNVLDLSAAPAAVTTVNAAGGCSPLPDCVTGLNANPVLTGGSASTDYFEGVQTFDGSSGGSTTFDSSGASGLVFNGRGTLGLNKLDLSTAPTATRVQDSACNGSVSAGASSETFSGIAEIVGSAGGSTTFVGSPSQVVGGTSCGESSPQQAVTFQGQGPNNVLDLSAVPTGTNAATVDTGAGSVLLVGTPGVLETFANIATFDGPSTGNTTFKTGATGGFTFSGSGNGNTLSFANVPTHSTGVLVNIPAQSASPGTGTDNFSDMATFVGSPNNDTFDLGALGSTIFGGGGSNDTLNLSAASGPTVSLAEASIPPGNPPNPTSVATVTASSSSTMAYGFATFIGASGGNTTFNADSFGGYTFDAASGTTGNMLSFQNFESTSGPGVSLAITSSTGNGTASGLQGALGGTSDTFQNVQSFVGAGGSTNNNFSAAAGSFTLAGGSTGTNSLSFDNPLAPASAAVTFNLTTPTQTATGAGIGDFISQFQQFTGAPVGGNIFEAPAGGGYTFTGEGSGNNLNLAAATTNVTIDLANSQVDNLSPAPADGSVCSGSPLSCSTTDNFADIQGFQGSATLPASYIVGCAGGLQLNGAGTGTTLQITGCTGLSPIVVNTTTSPGTITGLTNGQPDTFTNITSFEGPTSGHTAFVATGSAGGYTFTGQGVGNTLDISSFASGATVNDTASPYLPTSTPAHSAGLTSTSSDGFADISCFVGSTQGSTTFVSDGSASSPSSCDEPGEPQLTFAGQGKSNSLQLPAVSTTPGAPAVLSIPPTGSGSLTGGNLSTNETFQDISSFRGPTSGNTTFVTGQVGGYSFTGGTGGGNVLSFNGVTDSSGVQVLLNDSPAQANLETGSDTFSGFNTVVGSPNSDSFTLGSITNGIALYGGGGQADTLNLGPVTGPSVSMSEQSTANPPGGSVNPTSKATVTGGGNTAAAYGFSVFDGSTGGNTTFVGDSFGGYGFDAASGTTGNQLSFQNFETSTGPGVSIAIASSAGNGTVTGATGGLQQALNGTNSTTDSFQNIQAFTGAGGTTSNTVSVGSGSFTLTGGSTGLNTLSFANAPSGITANLTTSPTQSVTGAGISDSISGFESFAGAQVGGNTFEAPAAGGDTFGGGTGTGNTLDATTAPSGVTIDVGLGQITNLGSGFGGSKTDHFSGFQSYVGSANATTASPTTFVTTCSGGLQFTGKGSASTLNLTEIAGCGGFAPTFNTTTSPGSISGLTGGNGSDSFTGITTFEGPSSGLATFVASGTSSGFTFTGQGPGNTLDASAFPASATLNDNTGKAIISNGVQDPFSGINCLVGSSQGSTTFVAASTPDATASCDEFGKPKLSFVGQSTGNALDLSAVPASSLAPLCVNNTTANQSASAPLCANAAAGAVTSGPTTYDTFTLIQSFSGSIGGYTTFVPASGGGQSFVGQGTPSTNGLSLTSSPRNTLIDTTQGTVDLGGSNSSTLSFQDVGQFAGSSQGFTTFRPDAGKSYGFSGFSGTIGNILDLTNAPFGVDLDVACGEVLIASSPANPCPTTSSSPIDKFAGVQGFVGSSLGGTTFFASPQASAGGTAFTGQLGGNTVSFEGCGSTSNPGCPAVGVFPTGPGVTVDLAHGSVSFHNWSIDDTYSGIQKVQGSPNSDTFLDGASNIAIDGGGGSDTLSFTDANTPANVALPQGSSTGTATGGLGGQLTLTRIQNVVASPEGGTIEGNALPSVLTGGPGVNDYIVLGGADVINGGSGNNNTLDLSQTSRFVSLNLGLSTPQSTGGAGVLTIVPGTIQHVLGSNFGNRLVAGPGNVTLTGGNGTDWLQAGSGTDTLEAGVGPTTLVGGSGFDTMVGGGGSDSFIPGSAGGRITDASGVGTLDYAFATSGVLVNLSNSAYRLPNGQSLPPNQSSGGGGGTEVLSGIENIIGGNHGDALVGNASSNRIQAGNGNNLIVGNGGGDTLIGGSGTNVFFTGSGNNVVRGGSGSNTIDYSTAPAGVSVNLARGSASSNGWGGSDTLSNIRNIIGSQYKDVLQLGSRPGTIQAGNGVDVALTGSPAGGDTLLGGSGGDTFTSLGPNDNMVGGSGDDQFFANNGFLDYMHGNGGYNIAFIDCADLNGHTYTQIQELHAPTNCKKSGSPSSMPSAKTLVIPFGPAGQGGNAVTHTATPATKPATKRTTPATKTTKAATTTTTVPKAATRVPKTSTTVSKAKASSRAAGAAATQAGRAGISTMAPGSRSWQARGMVSS